VGHVLPSEREFCVQLEVSRSSLREAMRVLELVGVVQRQRGGPARVGGFDLGLLTAWISRSLVLSDTKTVADLLPVREMLEVQAAELAASNITDEQLARLEALLQRTADKAALGASETDLLDEDIAFHNAIFECANNSVLSRLTDVVAGLLRELRFNVLRGAGGKERMLVQHRAILEAVARHDPLAARAAAKTHMATVNDLASELLAKHAHELEAGLRACGAAETRK
jgi:GntR family transcriptional regulator, transcriptional repressor for pyruvate dehydrogenase complex